MILKLFVEKTIIICILYSQFSYSSETILKALIFIQVVPWQKALILFFDINF